MHHYTPPEPCGAVLDRDQLIQLLKKLPALTLEDHVDTIATQIKTHEPGASLSMEDTAIIAYVDEAITEVLKQTDLDYKIEAFIRDLASPIAAVALEKDIHAITQPHKIFILADLLINECIGWSEDLGFLGQQFVKKIHSSMSGLASRRSTVEQCIKELRKTFKKEAPLFKKLEERLCDRELKVLTGMKAQFFSTELLNKKMTGQKLPLFIIFLLQSPWFEFMQQIYMHYGDQSKEWQNVQKLTEALIWSLQPGKDSAKQTSVMQSAPTHVRGLCEKVPFDTEVVLASLADVEAEHEAMKAGEPSDPCDFDLVETDQAMVAAMQSATKQAVAEIKSVPIGQWFLYDDPREPDEKVARIKLILNWEETEQLLLTNHNRRKVVHLAYGEMVNHLASGVLKKLNPLRARRKHFVHI